MVIKYIPLFFIWKKVPKWSFQVLLQIWVDFTRFTDCQSWSVQSHVLNIVKLYRESEIKIWSIMQIWNTPGQVDEG